VITQCSIRHLYALSKTEHPQKDIIIERAKTFERRRCNHHELEQPLSEKECIESVVVHNGENKHRYCVATQAPDIRAMFRQVPGVPLIYINRSVMIMEPMAPISQIKRERSEREKFRLGIKDTRPKPMAGNKRKRPEDGEESGDEESRKEGGEGEEKKKKKKKRRGPKGPNPLSVKKKKTRKA
jgi:U3 small nucleolar RNA-associated protein 23